jgi:hypothetical protein
VTCSPPFRLTDVMLPLAIERAKKGVFFHVAGDYLNNMSKHEHRDTLWEELVQKKRTARIINLPLVRQGVKRCQWLLIFKTAKHMRQTLKADALTRREVQVSFD